MDTEPLAEIAALLHERNAIDAEIADIINKPMTSGHLGEWIAGQVFDIALEPVANAKGVDGSFSSGPLKGSTVNVKWYLRREGILDMSMHDALDYYLVLTGPPKRSGMPKHPSMAHRRRVPLRRTFTG